LKLKFKSLAERKSILAKLESSGLTEESRSEFIDSLHKLNECKDVTNKLIGLWCSHTGSTIVDARKHFNWEEKTHAPFKKKEGSN
jgi:hypothetical protein